VLIGLGIVVAVAGVVAVWLAPVPVDCPPRATMVFVDASRHTLAPCEDGRATAWYRVRIGKNGVGKSREGDGKTPIGAYPLARPTVSRDFGTFVPIGYPTPAQRRDGFTGSAVGIHGPARRAARFGRFVNIADTTDGCVGLATDDDMRAVARWLDAHRDAGIRIDAP
jgi:L,D-peptidoglycan transpeptidase YkuD (ErfK/YbiS/YcfS/YnhG family)